MITTLTSIDNKTTKVKRLRENRFCLFAFLLSRFCFMVGLFFYMLSSTLESFLSPRI